MNTLTIPDWSADGVLPPVDLADPTSTARSPYRTSLTDFALRFATSAERIAIIDGFLGYRSELHAAGLTRGFQWIDGSFLEHVELLRSRPPRDVDVVTFYQLPPGETQAAIFARRPDAFDHDQLKVRFSVDAYMQQLESAGDYLVRQSAYWYGLWSHQRSTFVWKGFVEIDLDPREDAVARGILATSTTSGGLP